VAAAATAAAVAAAAAAALDCLAEFMRSPADEGLLPLAWLNGGGTAVATAGVGTGRVSVDVAAAA
jgi:hypothetical protein